MDRFLLDVGKMWWDRLLRSQTDPGKDCVSWDRIRRAVAQGQSMSQWLARVCSWLRHVQQNPQVLLHKPPLFLQKRRVQDLATALGVSLTESLEVMTVSPQISCHICGKEFVHRMALRQHLRLSHQHGVQTGPKFEAARDMKDGMPTCRHCGRVFVKRQQLQYHIEKNACPNFSEGQVGLTPSYSLVYDDDLRTDVLTVGWKEYLEGREETHRMLQHHCCLCHHWARRTRR